MQLIGNFLMHYDSDGDVDIYGFNGIIPGTTVSSRFFAMNGKMFEPDVDGIEEMIKAYKHALTVVKPGTRPLVS